MAELKFEDEDSIKNAIAEVRKDKSHNDWVLISYAGTSGAASQTMKLLSTGSGGVNGLKSHLKEDIVGYILLRTTDQIDDSVTVKFIFINWVPSNVPRMQKARISVHYGAMKSFVGQSHVDITANTDDELTPQIIAQKVMDTSGSGSRVLDSSGQKNLASQAQNRANTGTKGGVGKGGSGSEFGFTDEDSIRATITEIRKGTSDDNWILLTYEGPTSNTLHLLAKGHGIDKLVTYLKDDIVVYGLVRVNETIDNSVTTKFAMIKWQGENIPRMQKARLGVHRGEVNKFFHPFHVDLNCERKNEISEEIIMNLINAASGTKINVLETSVPSHKVQKQTTTTSSHHQHTSPSGGDSEHKPKPSSVNVPRSTSQPKVNQENVEILFEDEDAIRSGIKEVRSDSNDTDWIIITYTAQKSKTLKVHSKGSDGITGLKKHLTDDMVGYCLLRTTEKIDESVTVKFVFVNWIGTKINRMQRATLGTHRGAVLGLFQPFHVDHDAEKQEELNEEIIKAKIKKAAGTAVYVLAE
eukprot:TRINITY_DN2_c0_g1_i1.p1 TRINITY_DN2_c0_g1~~TRINITY_DN2_c0_g1_i1.p1  ORF type:complete len:525 (+),score=105.91 TRINITY_DN2_c0_g1_i1:71-1645(+)